MILFDLETFEEVNTRTPAGEVCVRKMQSDLGGLKTDGLWGKRTLRAYTKVYGPPVTREEDLPRLKTPRMVFKWGYHHAGGWPVRDVSWEKFTEADTWQNGMIRLVSGRRNRGWYSRPPSSWVSLDTASIGIAHWWAGRIPTMLPEIVGDLPFDELCALVGEDRAMEMLSEPFLRKFFGNKTGRTHFKHKHLPLLRAWHAVASLDPIQQAQKDIWIQTTVPRALDIVEGTPGWDEADDDGGRLVAGVARMVNSSPVRAKRYVKWASKRPGSPIEQLKVAMGSLKTNGGYGHPERFKAIVDEPRFRGPYRSYI